MRHPSERGVTLLEVMVALTLLLWGAVPLLTLLRDVASSDRRQQQREAEMDAAAQLLTVTALMTRRDLDRRLGSHQVGTFLATVQRPEPRLYRLSVASADAPDVDLVVTVVYREAEPLDGP